MTCSGTTSDCCLFVRVVSTIFFRFCSISSDWHRCYVCEKGSHLHSFRLLPFLLLFLPRQFARNDHLCGLVQDAARRHIDRIDSNENMIPKSTWAAKGWRGEDQRRRRRRKITALVGSPGSVWTHRQQMQHLLRATEDGGMQQLDFPASSISYSRDYDLLYAYKCTSPISTELAFWTRQ